MKHLLFRFVSFLIEQPLNIFIQDVQVLKLASNTVKHSPRISHLVKIAMLNKRDESVDQRQPDKRCDLNLANQCSEKKPTISGNEVHPGDTFAQFPRYVRQSGLRVDLAKRIAGI